MPFRSTPAGVLATEPMRLSKSDAAAVPGRSSRCAGIFPSSARRCSASSCRLAAPRAPREHTARHHDIVDEPGRVCLHLYEASHDIGAVNVRGAGLVGTGHLRALLHHGRESHGVRPLPRVALAPPLVRVFQRGSEASAEGRVAAERGDTLVHVRSLLPLPRREKLRELLEEATAPNRVAQRDSRVQTITRGVRVSRRGRSRGIDGRGLVLVRDQRHARFPAMRPFSGFPSAVNRFVPALVPPPRRPP